MQRKKRGQFTHCTGPVRPIRVILALIFEENSSVFVKKQICIITNDMLNTISSGSLTMGCFVGHLSLDWTSDGARLGIATEREIKYMTGFCLHR